MELTIEEILRIFENELSRCEVGPLTYTQRGILQRLLEYERAGDRVPPWETIADNMQLSPGHVRDSASGLYTLVRAVVGEEASVKKGNCGRIVRDFSERLDSVAKSSMVGRDRELQTLLQAIAQERRRIICVSGPPRVGKTYLVHGLWDALRTQGRFRRMVRCYATESPTVAALYQSVITQLGGTSQPSAAPQTALTHLLSSHEYLLVLEKTEVLHDSHRPDGTIQESSRCYEQWFRSLLDRPNLKSCIVLVCRQPPSCLRVSADTFLELPLRGLQPQDAEALLVQQQLHHLAVQDRQRVMQFCGHNPGLLVAAAYKIRQQIGNGPHGFLHYPLNHRHADDGVWREAVQALSPDEQQALGWLLLYPDVCIEHSGMAVVVDDRASWSLTAAFQALTQRGLVTQLDGGIYCLAMEWLYHVVAWYLRQSLARALQDQEVQPFGKHPILVPGAPLWRRQWIQRAVLAPVDQEWRTLNGDAWRERYRRDAINSLLAQVRADSNLKDSYAVGNLLNIAVALGVRLHTLNLTGLTIRHADLSIADPQQMNLSGCTVKDSALPLPMYGQLKAALSPDGRTFAVGDTTGRVLCWRRDGNRYCPYRFAQFRDDNGHHLPIVNLSFGNDKILAVAAGHQVYSWWYEAQELAPSYLMSVAVSITSLASCHNDYVAVGLEDGRIVVWDNLLDRAVYLRRHHNPVSDLVANPRQNSWQLASKGIGDRVLIWRNVRQEKVIPEEIRREGDAFIRTTWWADDPLFALLHKTQPVLFWYDGQQQVLPFGQGTNRFRFSHNSQWVAALREQVVDIRKTADLSQSMTLAHADSCNDMMLSNDGCWLLTKHYDEPHRLRLWDIHQGAVCWELTARETSGAGSGPHMRGIQGLSSIERAFWQSYGVNV